MARSRRSRGSSLSLPVNFDAEEIRSFLSPRAIPAIELVTDSTYVRSTRMGDRIVTIATRFRDAGRRRWLEIESRPRLPAGTLEPLARRLFDLDADLEGFRRQVADDPVLGPLVSSQPALRVIQYLDPFEGLVRAIIGQQVSVAGARTMADRLVRLFSTAAPEVDNLALLAFPTPALVLEHGGDGLRSIGLTRAKAASIVGASEAIVAGELEWDVLRQASADEAQARLECLHGVGPWTAAYVRMRVLRDRDAFLPTDLGVVKALTRAGAGTTPPSTKAIVAQSEAWRPWRAYATLHLWRSLAGVDRGARTQRLVERGAS